MADVQVIRDVYFNTSSPACFSNVDAVYREAKNKNKNITRKQVIEFLSKQEAYTRHRQLRKRFKRNKITSSGLDVDWQADLADLRHLKQWNSHYSYLLVLVDVSSRFAFVVPIKKKTPQEVADAMKHVIETSGRKPWYLTTDKGKEFVGKPFQEFLRKEDIFYKYATSPDVKCAIAERYIRTLKTRIWRFFTKYNTKRYLDVLPNIVAAINNSVNRTIRLAPSSITRKNEDSVWKTLYKEKPVIPKFKPKDLVRIRIEKGVLSKGYRPNFSEEIFVVDRILRRNPTTYKLKDSANEEVDGVFYNEELVKVLEETPIRKIKTIKKSVQRDGDLWHLVKFEDKEESWIKNDELVSI